MLGCEELEEVIDKIIDKVTLANQSGNLNELLIAWGFEPLVSGTTSYETEKNGKIVVIGASEVKENVLRGIVKSLDLDKGRFEFYLDYDKIKNYQYRKLRYNPDYRLVLFGPVPHSTTGKNDSSSVIAEMQNHEGYPRVEVLCGNNAVKITKSNFRKALSQLLAEQYI